MSFRRIGERPTSADRRFPAAVDQLDGIEYSEGWIRETVHVMHVALPRVMTLPAASRARLALRMLDVGDVLVDRRHPVESPERAHQTLRDLLRAV